MGICQNFFWSFSQPLAFFSTLLFSLSSTLHILSVNRKSLVLIMDKAWKWDVDQF